LVEEDESVGAPDLPLVEDVNVDQQEVFISELSAQRGGLEQLPASSLRTVCAGRWWARVAPRTSSADQEGSIFRG